jgi:DNA-binding NtrC family response regulator
LDHLAARCKAKEAAVVTVVTDELASFAGEVLLSRLTALQVLWKVEAKNLRAGRTVLGDDFSVMPLMDARTLIGLLFVAGGVGLELKDPAVVALAAALNAAREHPLPDDADELEIVPAVEFARRRLLAALERHEWNIARVARLIGVTRRTVYLRLKRYKIDRQRVPKTLKTCPHPGGA